MAVLYSRWLGSRPGKKCHTQRHRPLRTGHSFARKQRRQGSRLLAFPKNLAVDACITEVLLYGHYSVAATPSLLLHRGYPVAKAVCTVVFRGLTYETAARWVKRRVHGLTDEALLITKRYRGRHSTLATSGEYLL